VSFDAKAATPVVTAALGVPEVPATGLRGREVRWVRTATALTDLWTAHTSLLPEGSRPPPPAIDFAKQELLVIGGSEGGLELEAVEDDGARRRARVRPSASAGARFVTLAARGAPRTP
jgi:hypothetical protein